MKKTGASSPNNDHITQKTGWGFNNEIIYTVRELDLLKEASVKHSSMSDAFNERLGNLDEINKYINRKK